MDLFNARLCLRLKQQKKRRRRGLLRRLRDRLAARWHLWRAAIEMRKAEARYARSEERTTIH